MTCDAAGGGGDVGRIHGVAADPFDGHVFAGPAGGGFGVSRQGADGPAVTQQGDEGVAAERAVGADDEGGAVVDGSQVSP